MRWVGRSRGTCTYKNILVAVRTYQNVFLPEEKSPIEKAIAYLHESRGEVDLVIGELFGTDGRSLAEVVAAIRQIDKSRGFPG